MRVFSHCAIAAVLIVHAGSMEWGKKVGGYEDGWNTDVDSNNVLMSTGGVSYPPERRIPTLI